jgi:hypothetical protein
VFFEIGVAGQPRLIRNTGFGAKTSTVGSFRLLLPSDHRHGLLQSLLIVSPSAPRICREYQISPLACGRLSSSPGFVQESCIASGFCAYHVKQNSLVFG